MHRSYTIETASPRILTLIHPGGTNSHSIGPDMMSSERMGRAEATVAAELHGKGAEAQLEVFVVVRMDAETRKLTAKSEAMIPVPLVTNLAAIVSEGLPTGDCKGKTTLLRFASGDQFLEVAVQ